MDPKISIITVSYNASATIKKTIESVLNQTYKNIEYLIIDGKSVDDTLNIVSNYQNEIATVISESDEGIYDAMNKGIRMAQGDYVMLLNADDYFISDEVIDVAMNKIKNSFDKDIFFADVLIFNHSSGHGKLWKVKKVKGWLLEKTTLPHPSTIFRRKLFDQLGAYNLHFPIAADHEFIVRAYTKGVKFEYLEMLMSIFSHGGVSTAGENQKQKHVERGIISNMYFSRWKQLLYRARIRINKLLNV